MQISANGIALEVEDHGSPGGEPLVLIMGLGMQLVAWHPEFVAMLVARGFRVIRFDNRDIGLSQRFDHLGVPNLALDSIARLGTPRVSKRCERPMSRLSKRITRKPRATSIATKSGCHATSCIPRPMISTSGSPLGEPWSSTSSAIPFAEICMRRCRSG